jgi:hypothetical protein
MRAMATREASRQSDRPLQTVSQAIVETLLDLGVRDQRPDWNVRGARGGRKNHPGVGLHHCRLPRPMGDPGNLQ